jgi:uncharacterized membrane protein YgcG
MVGGQVKKWWSMVRGIWWFIVYNFRVVRTVCRFSAFVDTKNTKTVFLGGKIRCEYWFLIRCKYRFLVRFTRNRSGNNWRRRWWEIIVKSQWKARSPPWTTIGPILLWRG